MNGFIGVLLDMEVASPVELNTTPMEQMEPGVVVQAIMVAEVALMPLVQTLHSLRQ